MGYAVRVILVCDCCQAQHSSMQRAQSWKFMQETRDLILERERQAGWVIPLELRNRVSYVLCPVCAEKEIER